MRYFWLINNKKIMIPIYKETPKKPSLLRLRLHFPIRTYNVHRLIGFIKYSLNLIFIKIDLSI